MLRCFALGGGSTRWCWCGSSFGEITTSVWRVLLVLGVDLGAGCAHFLNASWCGGLLGGLGPVLEGHSSGSTILLNGRCCKFMLLWLDPRLRMRTRRGFRGFLLLKLSVKGEAENPEQKRGVSWRNGCSEIHTKREQRERVRTCEYPCCVLVLPPRNIWDDILEQAKKFCKEDGERILFFPSPREETSEEPLRHTCVRESKHQKLVILGGIVPLWWASSGMSGNLQRKVDGQVFAHSKFFFCA